MGEAMRSLGLTERETEKISAAITVRQKVAYAIRDAHNGDTPPTGDMQEWWFTAADEVFSILAADKTFG